MNNLGITLLFIIALSICGATAQVESDAKPNVIVILVDDMGYKDVGFNGCKDIPTPNIDRIAANGVKFTNGYVSYAVCGPSRAGLITGRYQDRFGFSRNPLLAPNDPNMGLPLDEETLADVLKRSGYRSFAVGKWHLGAHPSLHPLKRGFDDFYGFLSGGHQYFPELWTLNDISEIKSQYDGYKTKLMKDYGRFDEKEYLTDALSRVAVDFIDQHSSDPDPFFIYLAYNAPHSPMQAPPKYLDRFDHIKNEKRKTYAAMVSAVDDGVGKVLDKLNTKGISENTIVFFLSDNGGPEHVNASDNGELRGGKGDYYEGGIRVPFAMQWPAKVKSNQVFDDPVISLDIFATVAAYANVTINPDKPIDGKNLIPFITGEDESSPHAFLFWRNFDRPAEAVRSNDYKYIQPKSDSQQLFNLSNDIGESADLREINKDQFNQLRQRWDTWSKELKDPIFLGLSDDKNYTNTHPERYEMVNPFSPDSIVSVPKGYKLIWNDEFNEGIKPDQDYWSFEKGFVRNRELQWYQEQNASIENGVLVFEGRRENIENSGFDKKKDDWRRNRKYAAYSSSSINTRGKFSFQYGILEVRAKIDTSMGMWPAIWTLGIEKPWPANGEIDVMEFYRRAGSPIILANAAWAHIKPGAKWDESIISLEALLDKQQDWPDRFHVWKMDWTEHYIRLYLDDVLLNEIDLKQTLNPDGFNPFHQEHYILLNLAIGSNGDDPSNTVFPKQYVVDYVRVYQKDSKN